MLWTIEDTPHKLIGSFHALPPGATLPAWAHDSYAGIERFIFESDVRDPAVLTVGTDPSGNCWKPQRHAAAYREAAKLLAEVGEAGPFDGLKPWRAAFHLVNHVMGRSGLSHPHGLDNLLRGRAHSGGYEVGFLEGPSRAFTLLDESCEMDMGGISFFERAIEGVATGRAHKQLSRLLRSWVDSNLSDIALCLREKLSEDPLVFHPLINLRHREWLPVAAEMLQSDLPTLFVVGALHTVGDESFINQLQAQGFACRLVS